MLATMSGEFHFYVYLLASRSRTSYCGVTNDLLRRVEEHRSGEYDGFTAKYRIHRLVYYEHFQYVSTAVAREKEIKGWLRPRKITLIEADNPTWLDLYPGLSGSTETGPSLRLG